MQVEGNLGPAQRLQADPAFPVPLPASTRWSPISAAFLRRKHYTWKGFVQRSGFQHNTGHEMYH